MPDQGKKTRYSQSFTVTGMTCATCVRHVERGLTQLPGVLLASVSLANERGVVVSEIPLSMEAIGAAVEKVGYKSRSAAVSEADLADRFRRGKRRFYVSLAITLPLALIMVLHMTGRQVPAFHWMELLTGMVVVFWCGAGILKGAWIAVRHLHANMDTLVSIGALTALATTVLHLSGVEVISFGAIASMLITLHLGGRTIESRLRERTTRSVRALVSLQSKLVTVVRGDSLFEVPVDAVKPGELVMVKSGEMVALDGEVSSGSGYVDESMISGEPLPVKKESGGAVTGGTLVTGGSLVYEVRKVGGETFLARMIRLVSEAQNAKVPIQALADRITMVFIPVVFTLALLAGFSWFMFYPRWVPFLQKMSSVLPWIDAAAEPVSTGLFVFVTTILIACPCALGLATPMALAAATGLSARRGLIIRNGEALQSSGTIDRMMMDKTGTITEGRPRVVETDLNDSTLADAASIEAHSQHPVAQAVVSYARERGIGVSPHATGVSEEAGRGISGMVGNDTYFIGKPAQVPAPARIAQEDASVIVIEIRKNGIPEGLIHLSDPIREDARRSIEELRLLGIEPVMLSGDDIRTARSVAKRVGIENVHAGVNPSQKMEILREAQIQGSRVGMVGDGINDAAALKSADLSIAMGTGTELAMESGDIVLVKGDLSRLAEAIKISRLTFRIIRQNLFWAFIYNVISIPMAMAGLLHPLVAEAAMTLSSVTVILNSARIGRMDLE